LRIALKSFQVCNEGVNLYCRLKCSIIHLFSPPQRRTRLRVTPQNLFYLEQSIESVFPLLTNMGNEADTIRAKVERYLEAKRHIIRGNAARSVGMIDLEIAEYQVALAINPEDNNAKYLLEVALDKLGSEEMP